MTYVVPLIIGSILLALIAVLAVAIAQGAVLPKCPGCGSRKGLVSQDDAHFTCGLCGESWPEQ